MIIIFMYNFFWSVNCWQSYETNSDQLNWSLKCDYYNDIQFFLSLKWWQIFLSTGTNIGWSLNWWQSWETNSDL